jgi:hypothetical protein
VVSNPVRGIDVCFCLFRFSVVLCEGSDRKGLQFIERQLARLFGEKQQNRSTSRNLRTSHHEYEEMNDRMIDE